MQIKTLKVLIRNKAYWNFLSTFRWRWFSILLLGIVSNTMINAILDYKYNRQLLSLSLEEYYNAIIASAILLESTRWLARKLDKKMPWTDGVAKRLLIQSGLNLLLLIVLLNILLITITYFIYGGFYTLSDLVIINISVVSSTFFFAAIDTGIYFFGNWKKARKTNNDQSEATIQITLGKVRHLIRAQDIRCAVSQSRSVFVITHEGRKLPYSHSLETLMKQLSPMEFFRANRQVILHRDIVNSTKALEHGKVEVSLSPHNGQPDNIVISRIRAADFRKWLKGEPVT